MLNLDTKPDILKDYQPDGSMQSSSEIRGHWPQRTVLRGIVSHGIGRLILCVLASLLVAVASSMVLDSSYVSDFTVWLQLSAIYYVPEMADKIVYGWKPYRAKLTWAQAQYWRKNSRLRTSAGRPLNYKKLPALILAAEAADYEARPSYVTDKITRSLIKEAEYAGLSRQQLMTMVTDRLSSPNLDKDLGLRSAPVTSQQ